MGITYTCASNSPGSKNPSQLKHLHLLDALPLRDTLTLLEGQEIESRLCNGQVGRKQA